MNLMEQQNVLKGLTDEHLQQELAAPTGTTPPFLLLAETNRRKEQRARYEGDKARQGSVSTVLEDLAGGAAPMAGEGLVSSRPPATGAPSMAPPRGMPSFADGGIVDYSSLEQRYADSLSGGFTDDRDRARAMALIQAGAGIMAGKSSNPFANIGAGIAPAVARYGDAMSNIDALERDTMRDALELSRYQDERSYRRSQDALAQSNADRRYELSVSGQDISAANAEANRDATVFNRANIEQGKRRTLIDRAVVRGTNEFEATTPSERRELLSKISLSSGQDEAFVDANLRMFQVGFVYQNILGADALAASEYLENLGLTEADVAQFLPGAMQGQGNVPIPFSDLPVQLNTPT